MKIPYRTVITTDGPVTFPAAPIPKSAKSVLSDGTAYHVSDGTGKFYADNSGRYLGRYRTKPKVIETTSAPADPSDTWDGTKWKKVKLVAI